MSVKLDDIPYSGDEDIDDDNSDEENRTNSTSTNAVLTTRIQVIEFSVSKVATYCRSSKNLIHLMKVAKDVFRSDCLPGQVSEEALLYRREVYCEYLAQRQQHMIQELVAKCRLNSSANPHFGTNVSHNYLRKQFCNFVAFISFTYDRERFCWDNFFNCSDIQVWNKRLEAYRAYCNNEYVFSSEEVALQNVATSINNRGAQFATNCQIMLIMFDILPTNVNDLKANLYIKTPKVNKLSRKPEAFPLCTYDLDKGLEKMFRNYYDYESIPHNLRTIGAFFTKEENVYYLPIADLARILKLKLAVKTGVRLSSINAAEIREASLKVNDLSIIMTGPLCFKIYVRIKIFKTKESAATYVIYSDGTSFDFTALMVVYLANRDLFVRPLSDCINQNDFTLKNTDEYLFPVHDKMLRLNPCAAPSSMSGQVTEWFQKLMDIAPSHINASSSRRGYFVANFCNFIQAAPYSSISKLYNMIQSRSGWTSEVCWLYGESPLVDATLLRNIYIHRVKEAMDADLPKPDAMLFVPTVTTAFLSQQQNSEDENFDNFYLQELAKKEEKKKKSLNYIKYLESLEVTNFNSITAKTLKDMQIFVNGFSTRRQTMYSFKQACINQWKVKTTVVDNTKVVYPKDMNDFRYLDIQAIAADPLTSVCHVFDESKPDYDPAHLWCTECKIYIDKGSIVNGRCRKLMSNGLVKEKRINRHRMPNTEERCNDKIFDRRYVKLIFKPPTDDKLGCGCLRGKCLKYDSEVHSIFNFGSLSAAARVCFSKEDCDDKQRFKECVRDIFFSRVRGKLGLVPTCAYEMFDIASKAYFPEIDEDDWTFVSSDYYFDHFRR